jgi:hypothetical protein
LIWKEIGDLQLPMEMKTDCDLREFIDVNGNDWRIFTGSYNESIDGIWAVNLQPGNANPELLLNTLEIPTYKQLEDYAFRPGSK